MKYDNTMAYSRLVRELRTRDGDTVALCEAVRWRLAELVKEILDEGVDPNSRNSDGMTPLMFCNHKSIGVILQSRGAIVNIEDKVGRTPLIWFLCAIYKKPAAIAYLKWLLSVGADISHVSLKGEDPKTLAFNRYGFDLTSWRSRI